MTSKIIVNTIEADTGISSVTFASNINLQNDSSVLVSSSGVTLGTGSTIAAPSANELALSTNSAERLRIDSAGLVGIGTDNPLQKLHLSDTTSANIYLQTHNAGTGSTAGVYFRTSDSSTADGFFKTAIVLEDDGTSWARGKLHILQDNTTDASNATLDDSVLTINQSGQIGIGTENPLNGVDIVQSDSRTRVTAYGHIITRNHNHSVTNYWSIAPRNGGELDIAYGPADSNGTVSADLVTIKSNGRIGINETSPNGSLHIGNLPTGSGNVNVVTLDRDDGTLIYGIDYNGSSNLVSFTGNNKQFAFANKSGAAEAVRILPTGGITFNGDTAQANAIDDYEEGSLSWRLQRSDNIGAGSNVNTRVNYTKIGNRVYVSGYIYTQNTGSSTSNVNIILRDNSNTNNVATLPYPPNHSGGLPVTGTRTISDLYRNMAVTFQENVSTVYLYRDDGDNNYVKNVNNVAVSNSQTHLVLQFCGSYTTNS